MTVEASKRVVLILSTMRSGSTLLKALMASADDVSDLPETNFQSFGPDDRARVGALSDRPIVLMKRPAWFHEIRRYPILPKLPNVRSLVLVRDVYETVRSLRIMMFRKAAPAFEGLCNRFLAETYWAGVTERLVDLAEHGGASFRLVRYEDLTRNPVAETAALFRFIGSEQKEGIASYKPSEHPWRWGRDDGGEVIRSLEVRPPRPTDYANSHLLNVISRSPRIASLRSRLGYGPLPAA